MISDSNNEGFFKFLDKLIDQCTSQLTEFRLISHLHKDAVKEMEETFKNQNLADFEEMSIRQELHSLITISLLDLCVILRMYKTSGLLWERIFLLRKGYLTIYESIKTYEKQKSKIRKLITESFYPETDFSDINLALKEFKKKYDFEKRVLKIRNKTSGHYDDNFDTFFDTVYEIDPGVGIEAIKSLMTILARIDQFLGNFRKYLNQEIQHKNVKLQEELDQKLQEFLGKLQDLKLKGE
jgi:hypothetical protein